MQPQHFHRFIIRPVLKQLHPHIQYSEAAEILLLGTAVHESANLMYWKQGLATLMDGNGMARGPYGIEPASHKDIRDNVLFYKVNLAKVVSRFAAEVPSRDDQLITNPAYATVIARMIYWRWPDPLPAADDVKGLARYHERLFNSRKGAIGKTPQLEALHCFEAAAMIVSDATT